MRLIRSIPLPVLREISTTARSGVVGDGDRLEAVGLAGRHPFALNPVGQVKQRGHEALGVHGNGKQSPHYGSQLLLAAAQSLGHFLDQLRRTRRICPERRGQVGDLDIERSQLLAHGVVQVLPDGPRFQGRDFHDLAFQFLAPSHIADNTCEKIEFIDRADRQLHRKCGAVFALGHDLPADANDLRPSTVAPSGSEPWHTGERHY